MSLFLKQDGGEEVVAIFGENLLPVEPSLSHPWGQAVNGPDIQMGQEAGVGVGVGWVGGGGVRWVMWPRRAKLPA